MLLSIRASFLHSVRRSIVQAPRLCKSTSSPSLISRDTSRMISPSTTALPLIPVCLKIQSEDSALIRFLQAIIKKYKITNNTFHNVSSTAVSAFGWVSSLIDSNTIISCGEGINYSLIKAQDEAETVSVSPNAATDFRLTAKPLFQTMSFPLKNGRRACAVCNFHLRQRLFVIK